MRKVKILLLTALIALLAVSLVTFFQGSRIGYGPAGLVESLPDYIDMRLSGVNYTEVSEGERDWTLQADTMRSYKSTGMLVFDRVEITFFTDEGLYKVTSDQARYYKKFKKIRLTGRVKGWDKKGYVLTANELQYEVESRQATVPGRFKITGPKLDLTGLGLVVFVQENRMKVLDQANLLLKSTTNIL